MRTAWTRARILLAATMLAASLNGQSVAADHPSGIGEAQARMLADQEMHRRTELENETRQAHGLPTVTFQQFLTERHANEEIRIERRSTSNNSCTFRHMYVTMGLGDEKQYRTDKNVDLWRVTDGDMANQLMGRSYYLVQYGAEALAASHLHFFTAGYCVFVDAMSGNILYFVYRN